MEKKWEEVEITSSQARLQWILVGHRRKREGNQICEAPDWLEDADLSRQQKSTRSDWFVRSGTLPNLVILLWHQSQFNKYDLLDHSTS